ncbi:MAG: Fur family transcriptional regulator [Syntrophales bacterium]|nr:Fur family transcriptional regulator [Syntrophales bacterium]
MKSITKEGLVRQLREKGFKITPQRLAILDALMENGHLHPGANLIYEEARKKTKSVSLSTVYATLGEFSRQGLIKFLEFDRVENRYDANLEEHVNLVCRQCGKIEDYSIPPSIEPKDIAKKAGFQVMDARMEYYGYCRDCIAHRPDLPGAQKGQDRAS